MIDWRHWHNEPFLVGGVVLLGWLWALMAGPFRRRLVASATTAWGGRAPVSPSPEVPFPRGHAWRFYSSLVIFYIAVGSPLDQIGERFLFSVHMLQHQLLMYPAAVLFLLGLPDWMVDGLLSKAGLGIDPSGGTRRTPLHRALALLVHPLSCAIIYTLVISVWHMPSLYDWALRDKVVHVTEHLMFFGVSLFYWWPMLSPSKLLPAISYAAQMLYFLAVLIGMTPVFAYITFSNDILYPTYEYAPRLVATFSAASDQLLAGAGMKIIGMLVALAAIGVSFYRWSQQTGPDGRTAIGRVQ